jgi:hypothetical protein
VFEVSRLLVPSQILEIHPKALKFHLLIESWHQVIAVKAFSKHKPRNCTNDSCSLTGLLRFPAQLHVLDDFFSQFFLSPNSPLSRVSVFAIFFLHLFSVIALLLSVSLQVPSRGNQKTLIRESQSDGGATDNCRREAVRDWSARDPEEYSAKVVERCEI